MVIPHIRQIGAGSAKLAQTRRAVVISRWELAETRWNLVKLVEN